MKWTRKRLEYRFMPYNKNQSRNIPDQVEEDQNEPGEVDKGNPRIEPMEI